MYGGVQRCMEVRRGVQRCAEVHGGVWRFFKEVVGEKIRILC